MDEEFKIVRILDEFSVVINGGYNNGVKTGDIFQIYLPGEEIYDPDNSSLIIGRLDKIKATIIASEISPDLSICVNASKGTDVGIQFSELVAMIHTLSPKNLPLKIDPTQVEPTKLIDEPIKLGDNVRKIPK